jgi:hypothetical protein
MARMCGHKEERLKVQLNNFMARRMIEDAIGKNSHAPASEQRILKVSSEAICRL